MSQPRALSLAIAYWRRDMEPPVDLIMSLTALGINVERAEQTHRI